MRGWALFALLIGVTLSACNLTKTGEAQDGQLSRGVVDPYLRIEDALANDSIDNIRQNAGEVATAASGLGAFAFKIGPAALQLASAADLEDARTKFGLLSEAIEAYMNNQHLKAPEGVRVAFCPMKLKPWLQEDGPIHNPYYGSTMPTCGSFRN